MVLLDNNLKFPPVSMANKDGLLAVGGDLSITRLVLAYRSGIFPWYSNNDPILWWSPDPRFVLFPQKLKISKSMRQFLRKSNYKITFNQAFETVIINCAKAPRPGQGGTWITDQMRMAYIELYKAGYAKSVEVWDSNDLIGGLYGIDLGNAVFCGESMFAKRDNASKLALVSLVQNLDYRLIDCQIYTEHLESLGAENISRKEFLDYIKPINP